MIHRQNNVLKTAASGSPAFAASYTVNVLPVGAVAVSFAGNTATVDGGHGFAAGDKVLVFDGTTATFVAQVLSSVTATTLVWSSATPTIALGNLLCNLGPDTASGSTPTYDASPMKTYSDADGGTAITNSKITCSATGEYDYYFEGDGRCWELVRDSSGTVAGVVDGWGGLPERYNIADYGAAVDGSTDDYLRVDAAIVAANAQGGGTVFFPEGDTEFGGTVTLRTGVNLAGAGKSSKISTSTGTVNLFKGTAVDDIDISNLFMEGGSPENTTDSTGLAIWTVTTCERVSVHHCHFEKHNTVWHDSKGSNISFSNNTGSEIATAFCRWLGTTDSIASDNRCDGARTVGGARNAANFTWLSAESGPIYTERTIVSNNHLSNFLYESILVKGSHCSVVGNIINANGASSAAINLESQGGESAQPVIGGTYNTVTGNVIKSCGADGIRIGNSAATNTVSGHHNTIVGNVIDTPAGNGISMPVDAFENVVMGNHINDSGGHGISCGATAAKNQILGNHLENIGTDGSTRRGILIQGGHGHVINGNYVFKTDTHGIYMNGTCTDVSITNNTVIDSGSTGSITTVDGIQDSATSTGTFISGNKCWSQDTVHQRNGILVGANSTAPMVVGNDCRGNVNSTAGISLSNSATAVAFSNLDGSTSLVAVASATTPTLPRQTDVISVTGTTNITGITASWVGRRVSLVCAASGLTISDGNNLLLVGDFVTDSANDCLTLVSDGTNWIEVSRSDVA